MTGLGDERPWHTRAWSVLTLKLSLLQNYRCEDDEDYQHILDVLRASKPDEDLLDYLRSDVL